MVCSNKGITIGSFATRTMSLRELETALLRVCWKFLKPERPATEDLITLTNTPEETLRLLLGAPSDGRATSASTAPESMSSEISVLSGLPRPRDSTSDDLCWSSLEEADPLNAFTAHLESLRRPTKVRNQMKDRRIRSPALEKLDELNVPLQIRHLNHSVRGSIPVHLYYEGQFFEIAKMPVTDFAAGSRRVYCDSIVALGRWMESKASTLNLHSPIRCFENHYHHG